MLTAADVWTWATFGALLVVMGARAWVVETASMVRQGVRPVRERVLTAIAAVLLVALVIQVTNNGGALLVRMLLTGGNAPS